MRRLLAALLLAALAGCDRKRELPPEVAARVDRVDANGQLKAPAAKKRGIVGRKTLEVLDAPAAVAAGTHVVDVVSDRGFVDAGQKIVVRSVGGVGGSTITVRGLDKETA